MRRTMKFVRGQGAWHLIDEEAPRDACVIATLRNEVEILAMKLLCEHFLAEPARLPDPFSVQHDGSFFNVVPATRNGKLILHITGEDGTDSCVETEFVIR